MKRIAVVTDTFLPVVDGVAKFTGDIVSSLRGVFEFRILAPDYGRRIGEYNGAKVVYFRVCKLIRLRAGYDYYPVVPDLFRITRELRWADVVFVQSLPYLGASSVVLAKVLAKPVAMYFHQIAWEQLRFVVPGPNWFKEVMRFFALVQMRFFCSLCDVIIVPSEEIKDVLNDAGIKTKKAIIRLGVDTKRFAPSKNRVLAKKRVGIDPKCTVIGFCGRMSDEKDVVTLIKAFIRLTKRRRNLHLLLVGGGLGFEDVILGRSDITITGFVDDVVQFYNAMDVFVMPSLTETTGLSTIEAMASGIPVVTTPVGIALTSISKGYNGMIFSKGDVNGLRNEIEAVLRNSSLRARLAKNARKTAVESYSWEKTVKEVRDLLEGL